jgi:hypothetical protein
VVSDKFAAAFVADENVLIGIKSDQISVDETNIIPQVFMTLPFAEF